MKRSRQICLLVLGTAALAAGCSDNRADLMQNRYASSQDCVQDWGDEQVCASASPSTGSGGGYVGPRYYWNHSGAVPIAVMPDGTERAMRNSFMARGVPSVAKSTATVAQGVRVASVSRGGFGSSARAASAGG